jgi:hypothetical protein
MAGNDLAVVLDRLAPIPYGRGSIFDFRTLLPLNAVGFPGYYRGKGQVFRASGDVRFLQSVARRSLLSPCHYRKEVEGDDTSM